MRSSEDTQLWPADRSKSDMVKTVYP